MKKLGFTLIELLISLGIMSILIVILSQVFGSILTTKLRSEATTALSQDSRFLLARLSYDVSRSTAILSPSGSTLELEIGGVSYLYTLSGGHLTLSINGGQSEALNGELTTISQLSFTRTDLGQHDAVQINLLIDSAIPIPGNPPQARSLTTTLATRTTL